MLIALERGQAGFEHLTRASWGNVRGGCIHKGEPVGPMSKRLLIVLLPIALAGCAVGHITLPMTVGPSDAPKASCLTYADAPAFGDCKGPGEVSIPQERK
jgi:hypothetical protein